MSDPIRERRLLAVLVILAFAIRLGLAIHLGLNDAPRPGSDQNEYDTYAWNVAQGRGYRGMSADVVDQDHLTAFRPPGPSLVWAGLYKIFGHRYDVVRISNCAIGALTVLLVFHIGVRCYGRQVGILAAVAYSLWPTAILFSTDLVSEPIGTFCFLSFILLSLRFASAPRWWSAAAAGALLGYSILTRPNFAFMVPLLGIWMLWVLPRSFKTLAKAALIPTMAVLVVIPWTIRNYSVFHAFVPLSTLSGSGLLMGNNRIVATDPVYYGYSIWDTKIPEYREALHSANNEVERDRRAKVFAIQWLKNNKDKWLYLVRSKLIRGWTPFLEPNSPRLYRIAMLVSWGPVLVLFLASFFPTLWSALRRHDPSLLLHLAIANALIINIIFWGEARYRHGIEPLCLIWAAVTVIQLAKWAGWRWANSPESSQSNDPSIVTHM